MMKSRIAGMLISFSVLAASVSLAAAQEVHSLQNTIIVGSGSDLRCRLDKGLRITKAGEPITAKLVEPVYIGTILAIPAGATIRGHVASVSSAPFSKRRLLSGDFTPPKTANVTFDNLVLSNGTSVPIHTAPTVGISAMQRAQYLPKPQRPGVRNAMKDALNPLKEPNKLQRLEEATVKSFPYHPEYLDQGTIFDAILLDPITTSTPIQPVTDARRPSDDNYLRLRLLTPLNSQMGANGASIEAVVSQPYYNSDHALLYPAGTKLEGKVSKAISAARMKKNGALLFSFHSVLMPDGTASNLNATVAGVEAAGYQRLVINQEGDVKATTSIFTKLRAPISLVRPAMSVDDSTITKTAWSRAGYGYGGFGLLGAGAAQASAATATGFGVFAAGMNIYDVFLAKGSNVELPINTPIFLRVE